MQCSVRRARNVLFKYSDILEFDILLIVKKLPTSGMSGLPTSLDAAQWSADKSEVFLD